MTKKLLISVHFSIDSGKQEMRIAQVTFEEKPQIRINSSNKKHAYLFYTCKKEFRSTVVNRASIT